MSGPVLIAFVFVFCSTMSNWMMEFERWLPTVVQIAYKVSECVCVCVCVCAYVCVYVGAGTCMLNWADVHVKLCVCVCVCVCVRVRVFPRALPCRALR